MMRISEAAALLGERHEGDALFSRVLSDTRALQPGALFVALRGENFDGHNFLAAAQSAGAVAAMVSRIPADAPEGLPLLLVNDTRAALGALAAHWRMRFSLPLVGVTGSNGKTTVKEMCAAILREALAPGEEDGVLFTRGNLNNDIGLPLTLLRLNAAHRAAVVEMGMNHPGEIPHLAAMTRPTVAIVNNAQRAHLQGMGSVLNVAQEKGRIFKGLTEDGIAVWNADDPHAALWWKMAAGHRPRTFGFSDTADVRAGEIVEREKRTTFNLYLDGQRLPAILQVPGIHNVRNALAAVAACTAAGVRAEVAVAALDKFCGVPGRLQLRELQCGASLWDDTYNANPDSTRAAIDVLCEAPQVKKILVLGDMREVGEAAAQVHDEIGGYAKSHGVHALYTVGAMAEVAAHNFGEGARHFDSHERLSAALARVIDGDCAVLVKGSRSMRMERVVQALAGEQAGETCHAL